MREMTAPGVWTDMGPAPAIRHVHGFSTLGGSLVTSRKAPAGMHVPTAAASARRKRDVCGHPMKIAGSPCARTPGHTEFAGGSHMTADAMAVRAERMRKP